MQETDLPIEQVSIAKEYSPSWVDHFTGWITRFPGPSWIYYLVLMAALFLVQLFALALDGILVNPGPNAAHIFMSAAIPYMLAVINYFNHLAKTCLEKLRPSIRIDDEQAKLLLKNLTTLPSLKTIFAGLLGLGCIFVIESISGEPYLLESLKDYPISGYMFRITYMILWWMFGTLVYHTIHQLRFIGRIYSQLTVINLYRPKNLYTFSNLIALTSFSTALLPIGFLIANPWASWNEPVVFGTVLVVQVVALAIFVWPHYGIHRLQVAEKENLLEQANIRFEAISQVLHQHVDEQNLDGTMDVSMTISGLNAELATIEKIPTWPWQPETLRILITALAFPLGVWLLQYLLGRLFSS